MPGARDVAPDLDDAIRLVVARRCAAQLCVIWHGQVVLDQAFGCQPDSLFFLFSASKPMVALCVHLLAERGKLSLDDPVARYWPAFGQRGKAGITIRQVLQHRSGVPVARSFALDALAMRDWTASVHLLERAAPSYPPGQVAAYHVLSYGFILGELVRRVTSVPVAGFLRTELLEPLGLRDTYLGLPPAQWPRHVPVAGRGPAEFASALVVNRAATRRAVVPAASVSSTARDLARLYQALLNGGELDGARVLRADTISQAVQPTSDGETDRYLHLAVRWSEGFQLGGERGGAARAGGRYSPMGQTSSRLAFGHNGSYACIGWADPERELAVGYLTGLLVSRSAGARHMSQVSDAILAACRFERLQNRPPAHPPERQHREHDGGRQALPGKRPEDDLRATRDSRSRGQPDRHEEDQPVSEPQAEVDRQRERGPGVGGEPRDDPNEHRDDPVQLESLDAKDSRIQVEDPQGKQIQCGGGDGERWQP